MKLLNSSKLSVILITGSIFFVLPAAAQPNDFTRFTVSIGRDEIKGFMWDSTGNQYDPDFRKSNVNFNFSSCS